MLGGEPTLHPKFDEIINKFISNEIRINIFTNGIIKKPIIDSIKKYSPEQISLTVNVNEPSENKADEWEKILNVFNSLNEYVGLGFNVYKTDFDVKFLAKICYKYKLRKNIRLGLAQQIVSKKNICIHPENYKSVSDKIVELSCECEKYDISLGFDCGFVMCMFTDEQLGILYRNNTNLEFKCGPAIDIDSNLNLWSCFPLSVLFNTKLEQFNNMNEIMDYYLQKLKPLYLNGIYDKCIDCKYLLRNQCAGGCASFIYNLGVE